MAVALIGAAAGLAGAGLNFASSQSAKSANEDALASEEKRRKDLLREIEKGQRAAAELRSERDVPSELFPQLVAQYPGMLQSILPQLTSTSISTTDRLAGAGADQFLRVREQIAPGTGQLDADRLTQINNLNPDNLGQEEILALTKKLSPLIPVGTLDPNTGAVAGGTTNPVSLYRNLISGAYNERRTQFLNESRSFVGDQSNAAARQQVSAARFLEGNLDRAFSTAAALTEADIGQQQLDIADQEAMIRLAAGGLASQYDPSANNALIAAGTRGTVDSLTSAAESLTRIGK
jgi:hypothetical protein